MICLGRFDSGSRAPAMHAADTSFSAKTPRAKSCGFARAHGRRFGRTWRRGLLDAASSDVIVPELAPSSRDALPSKTPRRGTPMPRMSASEAFVETLVAQGVTDVFGIVGSAYMDALDLFPSAGI